MEPRTKAMTGAMKGWGLDVSKHTLLITGEQSQELLLAGAGLCMHGMQPSLHGQRSL